MLRIVDPNDNLAVRNIDNILAFYDAMINNKNPEGAVAKFLDPGYIHGFFGKVTGDRANFRVVVHRIIASGDYVFAHVNFINLFNDDPQDRGIAGVDIYKMSADGKAIEHWDVLQEVGDPNKAAHKNGMF